MGGRRLFVGRPCAEMVPQETHSRLSPFAGMSVLFDDGCDYQKERRQSNKKYVRPKLALLIPSRQEKKTNPEGDEGQREQAKEPFAGLTVKMPEMKGGDTTQGDDRSDEEIVHRWALALAMFLISIPIRARTRAE
jgi:hypothetical protein